MSIGNILPEIPGTTHFGAVAPLSQKRVMRYPEVHGYFFADIWRANYADSTYQSQSVPIPDNTAFPWARDKEFSRSNFRSPALSDFTANFPSNAHQRSPPGQTRICTSLWGVWGTFLKFYSLHGIKNQDKAVAADVKKIFRRVYSCRREIARKNIERNDRKETVWCEKVDGTWNNVMFGTVESP